MRAELLALAPPATRITCPACFEDHTADVLWAQAPPGEGSRPYLICPGYGRVPLEPAQLERWRIDLASLATSMARLLGLRGQMEEVVPGRLWSLGSGELGGAQHDVALLRGAGWGDAELSGVARRLASSLAPLVLCLREPDDPDVFPGHVVGLARFLSLHPAGLALDRGYLESLLVRAGPTETEPGNYLRRDGRHWHLGYSGRTFPLLDHIKGFVVLAHLLGHPDQPFHALELRRLTDAPANGVLPEIDAWGVEESGALTSSLSTQWAVDAQALREVRADLRARKTVHQQLEARGDHVKAAAIAMEIDRLHAFLQKDLNQKGRARQLHDEGNNARTAILRQLDRALSRIGQLDPDLARLLHKSIARGFVLTYHSATLGPWSIGT